MTDRVLVENLRVYGFHGVLPEETKLGQSFFINIECHTSFATCAANDSYEDAVCYATLCQIAQSVSDSGPFRLIETLSDRIAAAILARFPNVSEVHVLVRKPSAPIAASFDSVAVEVRRQRSSKAAFSLGSNMGEKVATLRQAIARLGAEPGLHIEAVSNFYDTPPWGNTDQEAFVNACAVGTTSLDPFELLRRCKSIEVQLGRTAGVRWGPRVIDIDILYLGTTRLTAKGLTLPHAELQNRAFVLVPLAEIAPDDVVDDKRIADLAKTVPGADDVRMIQAADRPVGTA